MSLTLVIVLLIAVALIGVKIYFQEKRGQEELAEIQLPKVEEKPNEQIVADRLVELAKVEEKVAVVETKEFVVDAVPTAVENKPKSKPRRKKPFNLKKQPKIKTK